MPPVMMTGVSASASNPTSTLSRGNLKRIGGGQKVVANNTEHQAFKQQHEQQHPLVIRKQSSTQWRDDLQFGVCPIR